MHLSLCKGNRVPLHRYIFVQAVVWVRFQLFSSETGKNSSDMLFKCSMLISLYNKLNMNFLILLALGFCLTQSCIDENCATCPANDYTCTTCETAYLLENARCTPCPQGCGVCERVNGTLSCTRCSSDDLVPTEVGSSRCVRCDRSCLTC